MPKQISVSEYVKKQVVKGAAAVDASCPVAADMHVYEEGDCVYDALLNQTDMEANHNKRAAATPAAAVRRLRCCWAWSTARTCSPSGRLRLSGGTVMRTVRAN